MIFVDGMAKGFQQTSEYFREYLGLDADEAVHYAYVQGEDGYFHSPALVNMYIAQVMSPTMDDATFERLMDIMNYTCTEEGILYCRMGLKDVDWEYDENGDPQTLWTETAAIKTSTRHSTPCTTRCISTATTLTWWIRTFLRAIRIWAGVSMR